MKSIWLLLLAAATAHAQLEIETLGQPVVRKVLSTRCVTGDGRGGYMAWAAHEAAETFAIVGTYLSTGETIWLDTAKYGKRHIQMLPLLDGNLYAFTGVPGRFLKYDVAKGELVDLGVPAPKGTYWLGSALAPDGKFYIGTHPETELVRVEPGSGKVENLGRLSLDPAQKYIVHPQASDANVIYCPVGMHHGEIWAVDGATGERRQILPPALAKHPGVPTIWLAKDGEVYGKIGATTFLCRRDGIELGKTHPARARAGLPLAGGSNVSDIDAEGRITLTNLKAKTRTVVQTKYPGAPRTIFSVSCARDGVIYGGTVSPAHSFSFDPKSRRLADLGPIASGPVQVYDTLDHPRGLFISSYMNASVDWYDPATAQKQKVVTLAGHERPMQLQEGPDGRLYTGTVPSKGQLGGALLRVEPDDLSHRLFEQIIHNQSILRLASVPETVEIFGVTSRYGGSSAIPTEPEPCVFLWDCRAEKVTFRAELFKGLRAYGAVARAGNGLLYGVAGRQYYVFDPRRREVVHQGPLPVKATRFPELNDVPVGPRGLIYGLGDDAVFALDPADHRATIVARDPELATAYGFHVTPEGMLYFGAGSYLKRCQLPKQ